MARTIEGRDEAAINVRQVRRLYEECLNPGRLELLPELLAEDFIGGRGERGPEGFAQSVRTLRAAFSDLHFEIEDVFGDAQRVAVRWVMTGRHTGDFAGVAPTQNAVSQGGTVIYAMRDGRMQRAWLQSDRLALYQQVGIVGALPPGFATPAATKAP
jgi:predicted ester cyclase